MAVDERKAGETPPHLPAVQIEFGSGGGSDFTHPWVGQAEHLACRKRLPNAFLRAEARTHFSLTGGNASSPHLKNCAT